MSTPSQQVVVVPAAAQLPESEADIRYDSFFDESGNPINLPQLASDVKLTGYTTTTGVHALAAGDTVLAALAKVESRLALLEA